MKEHSKLAKVLRAQFNLHEQRLKAMSLFMIGVIKAKSVHLSQIANRMNKQVAPESNLRRLHRLLDEVSLEARSVLSFIQTENSPQRSVKAKSKATKWTFCLDRSEWSSSGQKNNILTLAVAYKDIALPLLVHDLDKAGCSNSGERIQMLEHLLEIVAPEDIEILTADREFASVAFLAQLVEHKVAFALRLTADTLITADHTTQAAREWFKSKKPRSFKQVQVYGVTVNVCGQRLKSGDFLIVITTLEPEEGFRLYKERWRVESLFGILKTRGFNLELSRLTSPDKLERLVILLGLAILWALRVGEVVVRNQPTRQMPNSYPFFSLFRRGLDALRALLIEADSRFISWKHAIKVLSCV
jgi:Transposase DDE domain